jgi:cell wall-associated NlpC family hydrolase
VRVRTLSSTLFCSLTAMAVLAAPTLAGGTGGVSAATPTPAKPATPAVPLHAAPITARTTNVTYTGPVYEKTATGEVVPYQAPSAAGQTTASTASNPTGGSPVTPSPAAPSPGASAEAKPDLLVPGTLARYVDGLAAAPMSAPAAVQQIVWAGNQLIGLPYIYGGGHASFTSPGYDCSGTVSFALHGANLLQAPEDSSEFETWGSHGEGRWVTIFSNPGHAYMTVAGLRLDTSAADDPTNEQGPRWRPLRQGNEDYVVRHPLGL